MEETLISNGIPLQICDIFLQELNKVDSENISFMNIANLLSPFLQTLANCRNRMLIERIKEQIFMPILENNITPEQENGEESEEESMIRKDGTWKDGG